MYSCTNVINDALTVDDFYRLLLKEGGVVETYEEDIVGIVGVVSISVDGDVTVVGSF